MPSYPDGPDVVLPRRRQVGRARARRPYWFLAVLFLLFLLFHNAVPLYTDWLWFSEVGYRNVFTTTILAETGMFFAFALVFFGIFYSNVLVARRIQPETADRYFIEHYGAQWSTIIQQSFGWAAGLIAVFLSLWAGRLAAENWTSVLEYIHATPFGIIDPVFHNDVSFYMFRAPLLRYGVGFLQTTLLLTLAAVVAMHVSGRAIDTLSGIPRASDAVRKQLLVLAGLLAVVQAFATRLDSYDLLIASNGVFTGAGYVDLRYRLLAYNVQIVLLMAVAVLCAVALLRKGSIRPPIVTAALWAAAVAVLGIALPGIVQKLSVEPNQLSMEQQYIARNIRFTRIGFGLERVREVDSFAANESLTGSELQQNRDTLANVRLWDHSYLGQIYDQTQTLKRYFAFERSTSEGSTEPNVSVDRYHINGLQRQVMLAPREFHASGLPGDARTWQNERLAYTHGYGMVMSPVNEVVDGGPAYFVQGFPAHVTAGTTGLAITQPDIYYGDLDYGYVFVDTNQQEFDPVQEATSRASGSKARSGYRGRGGIRIGDSELRKLAFSLRFGDQNVLLANNFRPETRVLMRRDIRERLRTIAPFLQQDNDPYIVLTDSGKLAWVIDCYTISDKFPYSSPQDVAVAQGVFEAPNYIRNSVKAVIDAYDGNVDLYVTDPADPIIRTYSKIFPGLLKPRASMPDSLRAHLRYPEDLFRLQRTVYALYHVDDPGVFYRKDDAWAIPTEPNPRPDGTTTVSEMEPYYVTMRLPDNTDGPGVTENEEFLMMSPLAPIKQEDKNILGWMCARCDGDRYGELVLYRFPQAQSVEGPSQIVSLINSDTTISKELSLLRSGGSNALLGNVLVLPIDQSLLYIAPLFVTSTSATQLPQLRRVVVGFGQNVAMAPTLEEALARVFAGYAGPSASQTRPSAGQPAQPVPVGKPLAGVPAPVRALIDTAARQLDNAQSKLKSGDFAGYGAATKDLERTIKSLRAMTGADPGR